MAKFNLAISALTAIAFTATQTLAEGSRTNFEIFRDLCMDDDFKIQDVVSLGQLSRWQPLEESTAKIYLPSFPQRLWLGWRGKLQGEKPSSFILLAGISEEGTETCGTVFLDPNAIEYINILQQELRAEVVKEDHSPLLNAVIFAPAKSEKTKVVVQYSDISTHLGSYAHHFTK